MIHESKLQRMILLSVLLYEGLGGLSGGILLALKPDGSYMKMPVEIMNGFFPDYLIPGLILIAIGALNLAAFLLVLKRHRLDWIFGGMAMGGYIIWFAVEIIVLRELHWLHIMWGVPVLVGFWMVFPLLPRMKKERNAAIVGT